MSLDQNLFTLHVVQNKDNPSVTDLVDPSGTVHYRKQRVLGNEYKVEVYDPTSESLLVTATAPASTSKAKVLELYNPTCVVELRFTGTLSFRWSFKWEEHEFEWKREECFMVRKPDPPVLVAVTKEPAGRLKTTSVQILDYNLNRFDIDDRKGLEIVMLTALLTFQDANEAYHTPREENPSSSPSSSLLGALSKKPPTANAAAPAAATSAPPPPPPKPAPKTGMERIAEMQANLGEYNEIMVEEEGAVDDYALYCCKLLEDEAILFVTVKSAAAEQVPKVLQVVEETKRIRHKAGLSEESELHQYVLYDTKEKQKGPRRINLDDIDKNKAKYIPPNSLAVHLSKISMPELQPKATINAKPSSEHKKKDKEKEEKDKKHKKEDKEDSKKMHKEKGDSSAAHKPSSNSHSGSSQTKKYNKLSHSPSPPRHHDCHSYLASSSSAPSPHSNTSRPMSFPNPQVPNFAPQSFYGPGAYAPPPPPPVPHTSRPGSHGHQVAHSTHSPLSYGRQPQPHHGGYPAPPPPPPSQTNQKPTSMMSGLLDMIQLHRR